MEKLFFYQTICGHDDRDSTAQAIRKQMDVLSRKRSTLALVFTPHGSGFVTENFARGQCGALAEDFLSFTRD